MRLTTRDRILALFVPAILLLGAYAWWINSTTGRQTELARLRRLLDEANRTRPSEAAIDQERAHVLSLNAGVRRLEAELGEEKRGWEMFAGQVFNPATRHDRVQKLNALLRGHGLALLGDEPAEAGTGANAARTSPALDALARAITERSPQLKPKTWRIQLYGRYPSLLRALQRLAEEETLCVPVGLAMTGWDVNAPAQEWTLIVWI